MNLKSAKSARAVAYHAAAKWLANQLPENQRDQITSEYVKQMSRRNDHYVYDNRGTRWCAKGTYKYYYKQIKKAVRHGYFGKWLATEFPQHG